MEGNANAILGHLPMLRRYARSLTGSQERGDRYVRVCLEAIIGDVSLVNGGVDPKISLFRVFHDLWTGILTPLEGGDRTADAGVEKLGRHIRALPALEREILLLTTLSEFSLSQAAYILQLEDHEANDYLDRARESLRAQTATRVLVIEDEPVIAFDLASIVTGMGHEIVGIADTEKRAVELARAKTPGIVLADIQLRDGSSGIDAARKILGQIDVPVIFITAFPERLLTGEGEEPTYLITKPFDSDELRVTISQALLLHPSAPAAATG